MAINNHRKQLKPFDCALYLALLLLATTSVLPAVTHALNLFDTEPSRWERGNVISGTDAVTEAATVGNPVSAAAQLPVPSIKANGQSQVLTISQGNTLSISLNLYGAIQDGNNADWWFVMSSPTGIFSFNRIKGDWEQGLFASYQGVVFDLPQTVFYQSSSLQPGTYTFYFGIDTVMNGVVDYGQLYYDSITVTVQAVNNVVNNVTPISVNGSLCSNSYPNKPCISVTICAPGTSTCQTIDDVLLDTGSYGLRVFKQVLTVVGASLSQVAAATGSLAECVQYGDGSSDWGPVKMASVILGNEPAVQVPIQVIDSTFGTAPSSCRNSDLSPSDSGFNAIIGVGPFAQDCGSACASSAGNGMYYSCSGTKCSSTAVPLKNQVQNPVSALPQDNNGVIVELPSVQLGGVPYVSGQLVFGIGTQTNNSPSSVTVYSTNQYGEITTTFNGVPYTSFLDTGSNGLFFTAPSSDALPACSSGNGWFCPTITKNFTAVNKGNSASSGGSVQFEIGNADAMFSSPYSVFVELGGDGGGDFDWGLPFHLGRSVYYGIEGTKSALGTGPYFAY